MPAIHYLTTEEYQTRYWEIIQEWAPPELDAWGETIILTDGARRYVRKDGLVCITLVGAGAEKDQDIHFKHEEKLMHEYRQQLEADMWKPKSVDAAVPSTSLADTSLTDDQRSKLRHAVAWDALSKNTKTAYQKAIKRLDSRGVVVESLTDEALALCVSQLDTEGLSPATLSLTVAAVKWFFKHILETKVDWTTTDKRLITIKRDTSNQGNGQVDGLSWSDVDFVCRFAEQERSVKGYRDSALIRLMSDCLLRISEAVAVNVEDLQDNALIVQSSKTDQEGKGEALYIGDSTKEIIRFYCEKAGITSGALFRRIVRGDHIQESRLTANGARRAIKEWANVAGIDGFVSGHSLRVGSAVSLAQAGASVVELQGAGRWKSPQMPAHYARVKEAEKGAVARYRYQKG